MEWGWTRDDCIRQIEAAGLPQPGKSSCFFCPSMKPDEITALREQHPDLFRRALALEDNARKNLKNGQSWGGTIPGENDLERSFAHMATVEKIRKDIEKTKEKISAQQKRLRELEAQLTVEENLEIVRMVKAVRMDNKELTAFLKAYASGLITLPDGMMEAEAAARLTTRMWKEWRMAKMKRNKVFRLLASLTVVVLCMTAFSVTAFAGGGDGDYYTGESAETTPEPTEEPATGGMEPEGTAPYPGGQRHAGGRLLRRQAAYHRDHESGQLFLHPDRPANEDKETAVHFLNQVDEADLMALMEDGQTEEKPAACTCAEKCQAGAVNTACPVCAVNMSECAEKAPEVEPEPEPEPEKESGSGGALVLILLLAALGGGGAFAYIKFIKPKQGAKVSADPDDYEFEDEEYENEDVPEQEEQDEPELSKLVICEKPSVAKSIASALGVTSRADGYFEGGGWLISWCIGHLVGLADAGRLR